MLTLFHFARNMKQNICRRHSIPWLFLKYIPVWSSEVAVGNYSHVKGRSVNGGSCSYFSSAWKCAFEVDLPMVSAWESDFWEWKLSLFVWNYTTCGVSWVNNAFPTTNRPAQTLSRATSFPSKAKGETLCLHHFFAALFLPGCTTCQCRHSLHSYITYKE